MTVAHPNACCIASRTGPIFTSFADATMMSISPPLSEKGKKNWFLGIWWHINLCGLFDTKTILVEEQQLYYLNYSWEDKGVRTFLKCISPRVNVIEWLEFELAYFEGYSSTLTITSQGFPSHKKISKIYLLIKTRSEFLEDN